MASEPATTTDSDASEVSENAIRLIGASSGVMNFVALTAVCYFIFESDWLAFGVTVGILSGIGSFLLIPWILRQQNETTDQTQGTTEFADDAVVAEHRRDESGGVNTAALGAGLEAAGIGTFAGRLALEDILLGGGVGIAAGLVVFLIASIAFKYGM